MHKLLLARAATREKSQRAGRGAPARLFSAALMALAAALLLSACGGAGETPQASPTAELTATAEPATPSPTEPPPSPTEPPPTPTEPSPTPTDDLAPTPTVISVELANGAMTPSTPRWDIALGEEVRIELTSDVADEIHVHGYDLLADLEPGETAVVEFTADIPGVFEVELHSSHQALFQIRVQ